MVAGNEERNSVVQQQVKAKVGKKRENYPEKKAKVSIVLTRQKRQEKRTKRRERLAYIDIK